MPMARYSPREREIRARCSTSVASATRSPSTIAFTPPTTAPYAMELPLERRSAFTRASLEFNDSAELYAQGLYADYNIDLRNGPTSMYDSVRMPPTNLYIPPDLQFLIHSRLHPDADVVLDKHMSELGPRVSSFEYDVHQATLGLRGKVFAGWSYDSLRAGRCERPDGNAIRQRLDLQDRGFDVCARRRKGHLRRLQSVRSGVDFSRVRRVHRRRREQPRQCRSDDHRGLAQRTAPAIAGRRAARGVRSLLQEGRVPLQRRSGGDRDRIPVGRPSRFPRVLWEHPTSNANDENTDLYVEASIPLLADRPGIRSLETV